MTTNNLSRKNIVIIGGTAGIGLATAIAASELGANVWAAGRTQAHIDKAKELKVKIMLEDEWYKLLNL